MICTQQKLKNLSSELEEWRRQEVVIHLTKLDLLKAFIRDELSHKVKELNDKYPEEGGEFFFYFAPSSIHDMQYYYEVGVGVLMDGQFRYRPHFKNKDLNKGITSELILFMNQLQDGETSFFMKLGLVLRVFQDRVDSGSEMYN